MQPGRGRALEGGLQDVGLLDLAVRLDDHHAGRGQPDLLAAERAAEQQVDDLAEQPDLGRFGAACRTSGRTPAISQSAYGVAARRACGPAGAPPVAVREQEVDHRRVEAEQRLVRAQGIVAQVDGAEQASEQVPEPRRGQPAQGFDDGAVAAPARGVAAAPVVHPLVAVQAHPDPDVELVEQRQVGGGQQAGVGLQADVHPSAGTDGRRTAVTIRLIGSGRPEGALRRAG